MFSSNLDWSRRAAGPELMDQPTNYQQLKACLQSLEFSNRITFNYRPTLAWLSRLPVGPDPIHIMDVGTGGGDMLRRIHRWAERHRVAVRLTGVDLNADALRIARASTPASARIEWVNANAYTYQPAQRVDIIISSLFTHHLNDEELISFLRWMNARAHLGWFISDLERQPQPYYAYQLLSQVLRFHRFVRHDGPLSIRRSFRSEDWQRLCTAAGLAPAAICIKKCWPARLCVSCWR